ncbi:RNA polymerase I-specific transcription initiation factor RRN3 [Lasiosphaeris hirsuta]|uniref:RNA polymerase I-specific transcription initiation factor RRN3 n=1 Tax=Lasiosphaeris hirsuta TaxID=260670 RepID=A0AA40BCI2_9PEZI|nr:RNA polymerase I-specific transcription initiation factor RRN3 [Lasiosphaeris hirsuta]
MAAVTPLSQKQPRLPPPSTIRPILRKTPSVLGKRRADDEDKNIDIMDLSRLLPSSPTKKRKTVMFSENLNVVKDIGSKTLEDAKREVKQALEGHSRGDDEDYDSLKEKFAPAPRRKRSPGEDDEEKDDSKPQDLLIYVMALTSQAPLLGKSCSGLIKSVLKCAWLERDENFSRAYIQLLAALSSVQGSYFAQVLSMMVDKFSEIRSSSSSVLGFEPATAEQKKQRLHLGLRYLLELFPAGKQIILKLVDAKFPYSQDSKMAHMQYIDHLLRLKTERPELGRDIMELILSRLVKLDVEMTLDLENDDDETTAAVIRLLEASDAKSDDGDDSDNDSVMSDEEDSDEKTRRVLLFKSKLETMDAILDLLFSIYDPVFENPDSVEAVESFQDLLSDFSNVILPHLKSRHTQYLVFNFALKSPQLVELFIGTLFNIAFESTRPPVVKQAAVSYLASFTARGAKVEREQVQKIAQTFLDYIDHFRATHTSCRGPDVRKYGQYYAYFQGLLYIFCFRWRDLIDRELCPPTLDWDDPASFIGQDLPWMAGLRTRLQANISNKLNPLKCCSPFIVDEFARLSHHLRLIYIYPQIEKNKNVQLSQFFTGSYATGGALRDSGFECDNEKWTHLETCFPFDPFQLPVSKRWLDLPNSYISWQHLTILSKGEEEEEDDEDDDEEGEADGRSIQEDTATDDEGNYD